MKKQYFYFVSAGYCFWAGWACDNKEALKSAEKDLKHKLPEPRIWQGKPDPMGG